MQPGFFLGCPLHVFTCVSTQRANSQSRSDSRLRYRMISAFRSSPVNFSSHTRRSARRQTVRATSSVAELAVPQGVAQPLKLMFCASISFTSASSFAVSSGVTRK